MPSRSGFSTQGNFTSPDGGFTRAFPLSRGMPRLRATSSDPASARSSSAKSRGSRRSTCAKDTAMAMVQQWNFGIQKSVDR